MESDESFVVDWASAGPILISVAAIVFAALTWLESRKQRHLLETMVKTLPYVARQRRAGTRKKEPKVAPAVPAPVVIAPAVGPARAAAEERRRLRLQLEREKLEWRKNKDIAKAIGWLVDRMNEGDDSDEE